MANASRKPAGASVRDAAAGTNHAPEPAAKTARKAAAQADRVKPQLTCNWPLAVLHTLRVALVPAAAVSPKLTSCTSAHVVFPAGLL